ncbi:MULTISPECIES: Zn-ribbon containing protein [Haloferax]|uniref:Origin-associated protein OapC n=1 Tax=Haloferax marinum TaxID=2666143 RepID=A0A6A8G7M1_9EURY|nr:MULTISPECIES: Zn-ribbon containing protein [Haloferax]KAB1197711.1 hypothetical protein Hfx1150_09330 [Haloferax sp. CBA1150]MRW96765.1 hypothetical protein [Haloferax marinum]
MPHQCTTCSKVFPDGSKEMLSGCPNCGGNKFQFKPKSSPGGVTGSSDDTPTQRGTGARDLTSSAADAVRERASQTDARPDTGDEEMTVSDWVETKDESPPPRETSTSDTTTAPSSPSSPSTQSASSTQSSSPSSDDPTGGESSREWGEWPDTPDESSQSDPAAASTPDPTRTDPSESRESKPHIRARETDEDNSQKSARTEVVSPEELAAFDAQHRESTDHPEPGVTPATSDETATPPESTSEPDTRPDVEGTTIEPSSDERPNLDELREELNDQFESIKIVNPGQYELNLMELYDRDEYIISLREDGRYVIEVPDSWGPGSRED